MRPGKLGTFDRFGWMVVGGRVEYTATDSLVRRYPGVLDGGEDGLPAVLRVGSIMGPCIVPPLNFTGSSQYAGTEIDVGLRYSILPGLFWTPRFGWAFLVLQRGFEMWCNVAHQPCVEGGQHDRTDRDHAQDGLGDPRY